MKRTAPPPGVDIDQLVAFQRIVREGSFSRAAYSLGIGQPAVSSRIQALERVVGGPLLTRGRRIELTPLGESFRPYMERALDLLDQGIDQGRLAASGKRGKVAIASLGSLTGGLVGPALANLFRADPQVEWLVKSGDHEFVMQELWDGIVELGIVTWPSTEALAAHLTPLLFLQEPVILVCHPGHALGRRRTVSQEDVAALSQPLYRLRWWRNHHPEIQRLAERSGSVAEVAMQAARHLVLQGVGAGFFTRTYVAEDLAAGTLVSVAVRDLSPLHRRSALVRRSRTTALSPAAANFVEALRAQAKRQGLLAKRSAAG
jgi:DNA-binding transcriptional LysR family regulator